MVFGVFFSQGEEFKQWDVLETRLHAIVETEFDVNVSYSGKVSVYELAELIKRKVENDLTSHGMNPLNYEVAVGVTAYGYDEGRNLTIARAHVIVRSVLSSSGREGYIYYVAGKEIYG